MSDITISIQTVSEIAPHPNAERLEIARILGTQTLVPKGEYHVGQVVVYFPPDICLPDNVATDLGVAKYLKSGGRVAACRLRSIPSYGFVTPVPARFAHLPLDTDLTPEYKAHKYEPPVRVYGEAGGGLGLNPYNFHEYTDIQNYWKHPTAILTGTPVRVTEKLHGTNSRVALLRVNDEWGFYAGSHHKGRRQFDNLDHLSVYWYPLQQEGVLALLTDLCNAGDDPAYDVILYGELFGPGVQDLDYGIPAGEVGWRVYDIMRDGRYLDWSEVSYYCREYGIETVPLLDLGPFDPTIIEQWTNGPTTMPGEIKSKFRGREGCVITPLHETYSDVLGGRLILKSVSADYRDRRGAKDEGEL